ncbi:MAG: hypothetical protein QF449_02265 [Alphaproteobacteria bacterium]|jgi:hypothetical protein|nr:hypothetical protein [Alphaproteobacteria bacterium]MDP6816849.1 hypothetical protein [Alphaproteobacteria bacterium]|tara:strand:- start:414 stop:1178 length:765 start_codon:yes stop_codon:yes gene_type:complete
MTEAAADPVAIAMDYPFARPGRSYLFVDGEALALGEPSEAALEGALSQRGAAPMRERTAVLAYGANAAPSRLGRKFQAPGAVFPVLKAWLHDFDIVYACHFSSYGALPATPAPCPGTVVEIAVTYLDGGQLARMHETELTNQNYVFGRLDRITLELDGVGRLNAVHSYWTRHGFFASRGGPFALAAIAAEGRRFAEAAQESAQSHARDHLAPGRDLHDFVVENATEPALRRERSLALRLDAWPFDHPHHELLAG